MNKAVRFIRGCKKYVKGDVASFPPGICAGLIQRGYAEAYVDEEDTGSSSGTQTGPKVETRARPKAANKAVKGPAKTKKTA